MKSEKMYVFLLKTAMNQSGKMSTELQTARLTI